MDEARGGTRSPRAAMSDVLAAARDGRPGRLRKAVRSFWGSVPSSLFDDPTESGRYDYFAEARAIIRRLGYRERLACAGVLKKMGEWNSG